MMDAYRVKLLEMLNYLDDICTKHNLHYYAIGGTFLGAVRHGGFIPWDDDIDVCMPRKEYDKFVELVNNEKSKYVVETPQGLSFQSPRQRGLRARNTHRISGRWPPPYAITSNNCRRLT